MVIDLYVRYGSVMTIIPIQFCARAVITPMAKTGRTACHDRGLVFASGRYLLNLTVGLCTINVMPHLRHLGNIGEDMRVCHIDIVLCPTYGANM